MRKEETRTIELNHEQAKQLRRAISLAFRQFDCVEEDDEYECEESEDEDEEDDAEDDEYI